MSLAENDPMAPQAKETIPTNLRLLQVMEVIAKLGVPTTPSEIHHQIGLPKATVHRLFNTLEEEGFLQRDIDGKSYSPGGRMRRLALETLSSVRIRNARLAVLRALVNEIGETCNIAIPDRNEMIYLDRIETEWPLRIQMPVGSRVPLHCTASGKMYLSTLKPNHLDRFLDSLDFEPHTSYSITSKAALSIELDQVREQGYALDRQEFIDGMVALAVGIEDSQGRFASTVSFHAPTQRMKLDEVLDFLPALQDTAKQLSMLLVDD